MPLLRDNRLALTKGLPAIRKSSRAKAATRTNGSENMTRNEINIEVSCVECGVLTPDFWLFETDKPQEWVCGDCVNVDLTLTPNEAIVEFLRKLKEGTK